MAQHSAQSIAKEPVSDAKILVHLAQKMHAGFTGLIAQKMF
jgi:hypothetical protein